MDLGIAIVGIAFISGLALLAGRRLSLTVYRTRPLLFALCLAFALVFAHWYFERLVWAVAMPWASVLCWANFLPVVLAFAAGLASEVRAIRTGLRSITTYGLLAVAVVFLTLPIARPLLFPIELSSQCHWVEGVCLQSNESSCGPAAAATLLFQTGHLLNESRVGEQRLSEACLTSRQGTSTLGLFRGLQLSVSHLGGSAAVASRDPEEWMRRGQLPNLAVVSFEENSAPAQVHRFMGAASESHALVVHSRTLNGGWRIADPASGWRTWSDEEFRDVFTGDAIFVSK